MRKIVVLLFFVAISLLLAETLWAQDVYYVQSLKAKIMSGPSFKAKVVGEISKRTRVVSTGKEGSWVKVKFNTKEGYIPSMLLSTHPPMEKMGLIKGEDAEIKQSVRRRASTYTSAAAARGLAADDRRRLSKDEKVDYGALEKIEAFKIGTDEVARFMEGNKL